MMCKPDQSSTDYAKTSSSPPAAVKAESDLYGSDGSENDEVNDNSKRVRQRKTLQSPNDANINNNNNDNRNAVTTRTASTSSSVFSGLLHGVAWCVFSQYLPFLLSGQEAGNKIYQKASFEYDPAISVFDNTIWTYGTDYALATITAGFAAWILRTASRSPTRNDIQRLAKVSASMLALYSMSTGAGAVAHQNFLTIESRGTIAFRVLWTVCVGTVYMAAISMGIIGSECLRIFQRRPNCPAALKTMPRLTNAYWLCYGAVGTIACGLGLMSFQRPACDIFIAGITQTPTTFYCMGFLFLVDHPAITNKMKIYGMFGFIVNAFLLPLYPFLVLNLGWDLPACNTILHCNLCLAWSLQGLILQRVVKCLVEDDANANGGQQQEQLLSTEKKVQ